MQETRKKRLVNILCFSGLALIALYSYFSSVYLSNFAELHLTIPKIGLPVFVGEILLFLVVSLAGLVFFLEKDKLNVSLRQFIKKYWYVAAFFIFVAAKALLGLHRYGFLALRNSAMFYYLTFAFVAYYFYRPGLFKPVLRYAALIVLSVTVLFSDSITYFSYAYYIFMLVFLLRERPRRKVFGLALFFIIFIIRADYFFSQPKAALISFGVALMYLVFSLVGYLYRNVKNRKIFISSVVSIVIIPFVVCGFMLNTDSYELRVVKQIKKCLDFKNYHEQYNIIKKRIDSRLESGLYPLEAASSSQLYQKNEPKLKGIKDIYKERAKESSLLGKAERERINAGVRNLPGRIDNVKKVELEKKASLIVEEVGKDIAMMLAEDIDEVKKESFGKSDIDVVSKEIFSSRKEKVQKMVEKRLKEEAPQDTPRKALKAFSELIESEAEQNLAINAKVVARQVIVDNSLERSSQANMNNIMWRVFVWKDMLEEVAESKKTLLLGVDFGYPFRSKSMEILKWSDGGWVGWLEPHNSYVHIFYRAGIIGIALITVIIVLFLRAALYFSVNKNITGVILVSVLLYWLSLTFFMVVLELPYFAIPFWSLFGITLKYRKLSKEVNAA